VELLARLGTTTVADVLYRLYNEHVAFIAYINDEPAGFGWMARSKAMIGELNHELSLPVHSRYLWNFRTMESFRGHGVYPALLQYIIRHEKQSAHRFWIIHAPENRSSLKGIQKTGFRFVGRLYTSSGAALIETTEESKAYAKLLDQMGIAISAERPASCWNCSSPYLKKRTDTCCCAPAATPCNRPALQHDLV